LRRALGEHDGAEFFRMLKVLAAELSKKVAS
jgi:hypothetical protein